MPSPTARAGSAVGFETDPRVAVVINPIAGRRQAPDTARRRAEFAARCLSARGVEHEVFVTERAGHALELARGAVERGASVVCAWGGDGTVNEVASSLAFGAAALAIIPAGSGNGLARELRIPRVPAGAFAVAIDGCDRRLDVGELAGRLFVNVAGIGFDAQVAARFSSRRSARGFLSYLKIAGRELWSYKSTTYSLTTTRGHRQQPALLIALANSRQYGNGAQIAPGARPDDGLLDLVVVHDVSKWTILRRLPRLFGGSLCEEPGIVTMERVVEMTVVSSEGLCMHVDGEVIDGLSVATARVHPRALKVRVPWT